MAPQNAVDITGGDRNRLGRWPSAHDFGGVSGPAARVAVQRRDAALRFLAAYDGTLDHALLAERSDRLVQPIAVAFGHAQRV